MAGLCPGVPRRHRPTHRPVAYGGNAADAFDVVIPALPGFEWSDSDLDPDHLLGRDRILDNISLYLFTDTAASSGRLYAESFVTDFRTLQVDVPVGVSVFPRELYRAPKAWAERAHSHLFCWNDDIPSGDHFAAFEQPHLFATELRHRFRSTR
jgi:hypothetical protein